MKKILKLIGWFLLLLILGLNVFILITGRTYLYKGIANSYLKGRMGPSLQEPQIFANRPIKIGNPVPWPISRLNNSKSIPDDIRKQMIALDPVAFLIIKNDSIYYEEYWDIGGPRSLTNSFSMAKSILGVLTGCAIKDGYIKNVNQPVGDFLPQFKQGKKSAITIKHLLTMSSGIGFDEDYVNPLAYPAEAYYGSDLEALTYSYNVITEPGKVFKYLSGDSQLLAFVIKSATGMNVSDYASKHLWGPLGAETDAMWNLDHENGWEKSFCCFYSNARDFARIGRLYKDYGIFNGKRIVDSSYVSEATSPEGLKNADGTACKQYAYQWWLLNYKGKQIPYMRGILGQFVFVLRDENAVVVRLGHKRNKTLTPEGYPIDAKLYLDAAYSILN